MKRIGITGQAGFIGTHLFNFLGLKRDFVIRIPFEDKYFEDAEKLEAFVSECDIIVHLAGVNRHNDPDYLYSTNIRLSQRLVQALEKTNSRPHVIFSSSVQEETGTLYGKAKAEARKHLCNWAEKNNALFTGLVIPNVFGPFCNPFYNSVVATFSYQLTHGEVSRIDQDKTLQLIFVHNLIDIIWEVIESKTDSTYFVIRQEMEMKVSELLEILNRFKELYFEKQIIPSLKTSYETALFNTFRSYIDHKNYFPVQLVKHEDYRGIFVEIIKLQQGGQVSFSITKPGIVRGNHFHTRKIERFAVMKGTAKIKLRRIGTNEILEFDLSGEQSSFVDMPLWYTHNIQNTGTNELYTLFWINEFYNPGDPDTFFENV